MTTPDHGSVRLNAIDVCVRFPDGRWGRSNLAFRSFVGSDAAMVGSDDPLHIGER